MGEPAEFMRVARLSLLEEQERAAIEKVKEKYENEKDHGRRRSYPLSGWHKHERDHKHNHGPEEHRPKKEHDHGPKHRPKNMHKSDCDDDHELGGKQGVARLSLLEEQERAAIEKVKEKYENEKDHGRRRSYPLSGWHKHERDHKHNHGPEEHRPKKEHDHGPKHRPKNMHKSDCDDDHELGGKQGEKGPPPPYKEDPDAPKDKGHFVLIIITLFGLVHILPFTFFSTANEYWMYKFRNVSSNSTDANDRTYLQTNFMSLATLSKTAPAAICSLIAAVGGHKIKAETRVFCVLFIHSLIFIVLAVFTKIDTDNWQIQFFIIVMALQMLVACVMSLGGSGSMGLISKLPPHYMKANLVGEGIAGVFSAILRLISIVSSPSTVGAALLYFITGAILMSGTSVLFYLSTKTEYFKYHLQHAKAERKENVRNVADFKKVLKIIWPVTLLFALPMLIPIHTITNLVVSEYYGTDSVWGNKYFVTVCTYLIPALTGLIGRGIFTYTNFDCSLPWLYLMALTNQVVISALIFLSNAKPRHHLPLLLNKDWEYGLTMAVGSLTGGFIMNLMMMKLMRMAPPDRIELSMMCNMFFMSFFSGITSPLGVVATSIL